MLTIFSIPKPCHGHTGIIQRNAIKSWTLLKLRPEIMLFGNDDGVAEIAKEFGLRHEIEIERNEYGTPLVSSLFKKAQEIALSPFLAYVNADIILMNDFVNAIAVIKEQNLQKFLMAGQRHELNVLEEIDFKGNWDEKLANTAMMNGKLDGLQAIDYFIFSKGLYEDIPPFAIGRTAWDNWLMWYPRSIGTELINATEAVIVVHQNHDFSHIKGGFLQAWNGPEAVRNRELARNKIMGLEGATLMLTKSGLKKAASSINSDDSGNLAVATVPARIEMAKEAMHKKNWSSALDYLDHAILRLRGRLMPHINYMKAYCLFQLGKFVEAEEALHAELRIQPKNTEALELQKKIHAIQHSGESASLPIHFFTIVLNGEPFIRHHIEVFKQLPFKWHWHIIEGVADLKHDTAWSVPSGGKITNELHRNGLSNDGTTEYLDELVRQYPENVTIYRRQSGTFWDGKVEMINAPLANIKEDCLLWQVDVDELWTVEQIERMRSLFIQNPEKTAAYFYCYYFVGQRKYVVSIDTWGNRPKDWPRVWRFSSGMKWRSHEPQILVNTEDRDIKEINPFTRDETKANNLIFQHFGYVIEPQLRFKEIYYGYPDVIARWKELQKTRGKVQLQSFLPWATDAVAGDWPDSDGTVLADELLEIYKTYTRGKGVRIAGEFDTSHDLTQVDVESDFSKNIRELFSRIRPRKIIETGTYLGTGTTSVIASTLRQLGIKDATFYTIEVNPQHYQIARMNLINNGFSDSVILLNGLSVPRRLLPTLKEIEDKCVKDIEFNDIFVDHKESERALLYFHETNFEGLPDDLLGECIRKFDGNPDFILLDSAGHMGNIEFNYLISQLKDECYIALDDIYHIKHHKSFLQIQSDRRFELIVSSSEKFGFCITKFTPKRESFVDTSANNILWIRTDSIGDNILAASMLPHIRQKYTHSKITVVCQTHIEELYKTCTFIDNIITFDRNSSLQNKLDLNTLIQRLQSVNADLALNSVYSREPLNDFLAISCNAKEKIALYGNLSNMPADIRDRNNPYYTKLLPSEGENKLELERHRDFLKGIGIDALSLEPVVWLTPEDEKFADHFFAENNLDPERTIALFAGAQYNVRIYEQYGTAIAKALADNAFTVIALGASHEYEINNQNLEQIKVKSLNLCGKTTIRQTAAMLSKCRLAVGAETGLAHIACAMGTPNVVLLGGGHFGRFMPYSPLTSIVCLPLECYGCNWYCKYNYSHCVKAVLPEIISEAVHQTLGKPSEKPRIFVQGKSLWNPNANQPQWQWFNKYLDNKSVEIIPVGDVPEITEGDVVEEIEKINKLLGSRKFEEANIPLKQAIETYSDSSDSPDALNLQAQITLQTGDKEGAKEVLLELIKRHPSYFPAFNNLAFIFWDSGDFDNAVKYFEDALRISQYERFVVLSYGDMLSSHKKYAKAKELYEAYLKTNPNDSEIHSLLQKAEGVLEKVNKLSQVVGKIK